MDTFDSIVCITQTPWKGDFQKAVVQLMTELSARHRVLYVDYLYTAKDLVQGITGRQAVPVKQILRQSTPLIRIQTPHPSELYVWTPPVILPINWLSEKAHDRWLPWNIRRLEKALKPVLAELGMHRPLVINAYNPVIGLPMLGRLREFATIYYCFDEITTAGDWMSRHGKRYEDAYLPRVDAVVTTSETLRQAKSVAQPQTFCVKNGANFELFHQARQLAVQQPPTQPIVGYLGSADNRINIDLVVHCAEAMPDVAFQFMGDVHEPLLISRLSAFPNVTFLPPRQPADLLPWLASLSVGIIPFVCNPHTYTIYPLKINEYLAAGLPVVSTPFSLLDDFADVIELADTPEAFVLALRRALADTTPDRLQQRIDMARNNTWAHRALEFEQVMQAVARAKQPTKPAQPDHYALTNPQ